MIYQFKLYVDMLSNIKYRKCFRTCYDCNRNWQESKSIYTHLIYIDGNENRLICDDCAEARH